jgi:hypothetical protein
MKGENMENYQPTEAENRLYAKITEYEWSYFEDFLLQPDSILHDLLVYEAQDETGNWFETSDDIADMELSHNYSFRINSLDDCAGVSNKEFRTITIDPESANDPAVILHEMIHAHIDLFRGDQIVIYLECLLLRLYNDLKVKIPDLDERIVNHAHKLRQEDFYDHGEHGLLFFLKSLDLDLRLGLPLGTVCSYGRDA